MLTEVCSSTGFYSLSLIHKQVYGAREAAAERLRVQSMQDISHRTCPIFCKDTMVHCLSGGYKATQYPKIASSPVHSTQGEDYLYLSIPQLIP
jgi:hypothetical protein